VEWPCQQREEAKGQKQEQETQGEVKIVAPECPGRASKQAIGDYRERGPSCQLSDLDGGRGEVLPSTEWQALGHEPQESDRIQAREQGKDTFLLRVH